MDDIKWLKRKYPKSFNELNDYFDRQELRDFKKSTLKLGILIKDVVYTQKYKKGSIVQFRKSNPINSYNHPFTYIVVKCQVDYTASGYHSFCISGTNISETIKEIYE